jgi:hypothetical protein
MRLLFTSNIVKAKDRNNNNYYDRGVGEGGGACGYQYILCLIIGTLEHLKSLNFLEEHVSRPSQVAWELGLNLPACRYAPSLFQCFLPSLLL